ncbi:hypothetical protein RHGRI_021971 [Rhododendron griersonianum]|uniref:Peptidase A1 domain-containing protein n=1 Tax=Rhododendron griersonianum TaxID=479676 RepID=A0AAV6JQY4_9ERIC|nr:hypothetical protein RHGRI_021971 [Rhododendron griersonianum]
MNYFSQFSSGLCLNIYHFSVSFSAQNQDAATQSTLKKRKVNGILTRDAQEAFLITSWCRDHMLDQSKRESLKVVHRHGPCSHMNEARTSAPTLAEIICYQQQEPIFNPSASQTYKNLSCTTPQCSQLLISGCTRATNTCLYAVLYGDRSFTIGLYATETLTLTPSDVFPGFAFGCGLNNTGLFRGAAGLLGLGRGPPSLVAQTASKYRSYFSYCLPTLSSSSGTLFSRNYNRLWHRHYAAAPEVYDALRTRFRQLMMNYTMTQGVSLFDTCYDFSGRDTVEVPTISFVFGGNVEVPIPFPGILIGSQELACLAFAGNSDASDVGIFGNSQQQTLDVVYDVAGGKLGFGTGGCS